MPALAASLPSPVPEPIAAEPAPAEAKPVPRKKAARKFAASDTEAPAPVKKPRKKKSG
jgi:hypothetical protein